MANFEEAAKKSKGICLCDFCRKTFRPVDTRLIPCPPNLLLLFADRGIFVSPDGELGCGQPRKNDKIASCPMCKTVHPYGFDFDTDSLRE